MRRLIFNNSFKLVNGFYRIPFMKFSGDALKNPEYMNQNLKDYSKNPKKLMEQFNTDPKNQKKSNNIHELEKGINRYYPDNICENKKENGKPVKYNLYKNTLESTYLVQGIYDTIVEPREEILNWIYSLSPHLNESEIDMVCTHINIDNPVTIALPPLYEALACHIVTFGPHFSGQYFLKLKPCTTKTILNLHGTLNKCHFLNETLVYKFR
jgi:hypothetical protein